MDNQFDEMTDEVLQKSSKPSIMGPAGNIDVPIQEQFTLPSHGKIYVENVKEHFTLRSMTMNEEMLRLSPSDRTYEQLCRIIDACMVDSPGISSYDMCLGDYIYCLYMLRIVTYGPAYKIAPVCKYCKNVLNETLDLEQIQIKEYTDDLLKYVEFQLPSSKHIITIQPESPRTLDMIEDKINMYKRKIKSDLDSTIMCTVMSSIRLVDNQSLKQADLEAFVRKLDMADVNTIINYAKKLNSAIGVDNDIVITCPLCGLTSKAQLAITSEFFRPTLDI